MNTLQAFLDNRESDSTRSAANGAEARAKETWETMGLTPEARLLAFDRWVCSQLETRLQWPSNPVKKAKLLGQCRAELERLVLDLWRRGWCLDGKQLAAHVGKALDQVSTAQREERVKDFWPFFRHVVATYVGANAEEIQREVRKTPSIGGLIISLGLSRHLTTATPSIPELVAQRKEETLREKLSKARKATKQNDNTQLPLL